MEQQTNALELLRPVETKRASEAIYDQVRGLIHSGELKPGDRLPSERNMMELFQRSRPTIREALRMLERAGYIRTIAGSNGAVVQEPDPKGLEETIEDALQIGRIGLGELEEYRRASEAATVAWAAQRRTQEDLDAMAAVLEQMKQCMDRTEQFIALDPQFHGLLAKAAKNGISTAMNRTLSKLNRAFVADKMRAMTQEEQLEMCRRVYDMHRNIYEAVKDQDVGHARQAMDDHLVAFGADLQQ